MAAASQKSLERDCRERCNYVSCAATRRNKKIRMKRHCTYLVVMRMLRSRCETPWRRKWRQLGDARKGIRGDDGSVTSVSRPRTLRNALLDDFRLPGTTTFRDDREKRGAIRTRATLRDASFGNWRFSKSRSDEPIGARARSELLSAHFTTLRGGKKSAGKI